MNASLRGRLNTTSAQTGEVSGSVNSTVDCVWGGMCIVMVGEVVLRIVPENQRELNPHCSVIKETVDYRIVLN